MTTTPNLNLRILEPTDTALREKLNEVITTIDTNAVSKQHLDSNGHFPLWKQNTQYSIDDIVRTESPNLPSWGIWRCIKDGLSSTAYPESSVLGSEVTDGTVKWKLASLGKDNIHNHDDLGNRQLPDSHPMSAITGLVDELNDKVSVYNYTEAGIIDYPVIVDNGNGSITLSSGTYSLYSDGTGSVPLGQYPGAQQTLTLTDQTNNYVCASLDTNNTVKYTLESRGSINYRNILPVYTVYRDGNKLEPVEWGTYAKGLASLLLKWKNRTSRFTRESGLMISESSGRIIHTTSGVVWFSVNELALDAVDSSVDNVLQCINMNGTWSYVPVTQYNNTQYNATSGLSTLSNNKYNVTWVYRDIKTNMKKLFLILGTGNYTLSEAQLSTIPSVPAIIDTQCILVGKIICKKDDATAVSIESPFNVSFAGGAGSTNASDIQINDIGNYYTGADVETALQEAGLAIGAKNWATTTEYKLGQLVVYGGITYRCITSHTSTNFISDIAKWEQLCTNISNWTASTYYPLNSKVYYGGMLYNCILAHTSSSFLADINNWKIVYSNIRDWSATTPYFVGDIVFNNTTIYKCITAHTSRSSFDTTETTYWNIGGTAVGISSMVYDGTASTFTVGLSDGTNKVFTGIGSNFYEGYKKTDFITSPIQSAGVYDLPFDITAQDFIDFTVGVNEGYYKNQAIKITDIQFTKTINTPILQTSAGSTGTVTSGGTYTGTIDQDLYLKVTTAPTNAGDVAGMVVSTSNVANGTLTAQGAFTSGTAGKITINGVEVTFALSAGQTFVVGELYYVQTTVDSPTTFLLDGKSGDNWYALKVHFKGSRKISIDEITSNGWTIPQIVNACGYKGQSNNVTAMKTKLLYSADTLNPITPVPKTADVTLSDDFSNYDYLVITYSVNTSSNPSNKWSKIIKTNEIPDFGVSTLPFNFYYSTSYYFAFYLSGQGYTLSTKFTQASTYTYGGITKIYGIVSGDGKVTMSANQDTSGKYTLTLTNVDGTTSITLPYVTLLSGSITEINGDNTLHITHSDGSTTIGEAKEKYDLIFSGDGGSTTSAVVNFTAPLTNSLANYRKFGVKFLAYSGTNQRPQYREFLVEQLSEIMGVSGASLSCVWGYGTNADYADIQQTSTLNALNFSCSLSKIKKIFGIY